MYEDEDADPWEAIEGVSVQLQVYLERAKAAPGDEDILLSARGLLEEWIDEDTEVDPDNLILYHRAEAFYRALGDEDLAALYAKKAKDFIDECNREAREAAEEEAKWNRKIYPNDPCPCGSGKKFKKCHGRKKGM